MSPCLTIASNHASSSSGATGRQHGTSALSWNLASVVLKIVREKNTRIYDWIEAGGGGMVSCSLEQRFPFIKSQQTINSVNSSHESCAVWRHHTEKDLEKIEAATKALLFYEGSRQPMNEDQNTGLALTLQL